MLLATAIAGLDRANVVGNGDVSITAVDYDSRRVRPGSLFCCVVGAQLDGHELAADAVARGATALLVERQVPVDAVQVLVPNVRPPWLRWRRPSTAIRRPR